MTTMDRIAAAMGCAPADDDDLVEAVRLLVAERDEAKAARARLRAILRDATDDAVGLVERVHRAVQTYQGVVRERDAARVSLADADLILEERERQLTAALTAVAAERARCAAVCRSVACFYDGGDVGSVVAHACADEIERECVSALLRTPGA